MNKKKRIWVISAIAVLLIVLGLVGKKQGWWGQTDEELVVEVGKVESQTIIETVSASGRIQPAVEVKISPEVSGEIIEAAYVGANTLFSINTESGMRLSVTRSNQELPDQINRFKSGDRVLAVWLKSQVATIPN